MRSSLLAALVCLAVVMAPMEAIVMKQQDPPATSGTGGQDQGLGVSKKVGGRLADSVLKGVLDGILDGFDPYQVPDASFSLDLKEVTASVSTSGVVITGASGLKLRHLVLQDLADGKATVNLSLPAISVVGNYDMRGKLSLSGIPLSLDGAGPLTAGFNNLDLETSIELGINDKGQITLDDFDLAWNMSSIRLQIDGLFGGQVLGKVVNELLHDALPRLVLEVYHKTITDRIISAVKVQGAAFVESLHQDHGTPPAEDVSAIIENLHQDHGTPPAENAGAIDKPSVIRVLEEVLAEDDDRDDEDKEDDDDDDGVDDEDSIRMMVFTMAHAAREAVRIVLEGGAFPHESVADDVRDADTHIARMFDEVLQPMAIAFGRATGIDNDDAILRYFRYFRSCVAYSMAYGKRMFSKGDARFYPRGSEADDVQADGDQLTHSPRLPDIGIVRLTPAGDPRFYAHGTLCLDDDEDDVGGAETGNADYIQRMAEAFSRVSRAGIELEGKPLPADIDKDPEWKNFLSGLQDVFRMRPEGDEVDDGVDDEDDDDDDDDDEDDTLLHTLLQPADPALVQRIAIAFRRAAAAELSRNTLATDMDKDRKNLLSARDDIVRFLPQDEDDVADVDTHLARILADVHRVSSFSRRAKGLPSELLAEDIDEDTIRMMVFDVADAVRTSSDIRNLIPLPGIVL